MSDTDPQTEMFRQMFHGSLAIKLLVDPDSGAILDANYAALRFYGFSREQLLALRVIDLNTLSETQVRAEMRAARDARRNCFQFQHRLAGGEIRDVEVYSSPLTLQGKTRLLSIIHDVTARNDQERELSVLSDIVANLPVGIYRSQVEDGGRFLSVNPEMVRLTEAESEAELLATPASRLYANEGDRAAFVARMKAADDWHSENVRLRTLRGNIRTFRVTVRQRQGENGIAFIDGITEDITRLEAAEQSREQLYEIIDATPAIVGISAPDGRLIYLNRAGRRVLGLGPNDPLSDYRPRRVHTEESFRTLVEVALPTAMEEGCWVGEMSFSSANGELIPVQTTLIAHKDADGQLLRVSAVSIDVSSQKRRQQVLEQMAFRDSLTGLLNRRGFMRALKDTLDDARSHRMPLSIVMLDLDHFKPINDRHGHDVGDEILRKLAPLLSGRRRSDDLVGRLGGEEFGIILPGAERENAVAIAEDIRERVAATEFQTRAGTLRITLSGGVTSFTDRRESGATLLRRADAALYDAKAAGRNCVHWR